MKILLTGGSGIIGTYLIGKILKYKYDFINYDKIEKSTF